MMIDGKEGGYQPNEQEVAQAESHMTKQEADASNNREFMAKIIEDRWNPDTKEDAKFPERYQKAEERGEKFVEIPVTVNIKVPAGEIITDPGQQINNAIYFATRGVEKSILSQLNEQQPDLVADAKEYEKTMNELWKMFTIDTIEEKRSWPDGTDKGNRTITFNEERFKASTRRLKEIADKYGFDASRSLGLLMGEYRGEN